MTVRKMTASEVHASMVTDWRMAADALARAKDGLSPENLRCHDLAYTLDQLDRVLRYVARLQLVAETYEVSDAIKPA